jgi:hypothetical protein
MSEKVVRLARPRHVRITEHWFSPEAPYTVHDLARFYNLPRKLDGRGKKIAILLPGGGLLAGDFEVYFETLGLPVPKVSVVEVGRAKNQPARREDVRRFLLSIGAGYAGKPREPHRSGAPKKREFPEDMQPGSPLFDRVTWTFEAIVDVEIAGGTAPGAELVVYVCENTADGIAAAVKRAAADDAVAAMNGSWGWSENQGVHPDFVATVDKALSAAAEKGVTCCFASGDSGARPGFESGDDRLAVYFPASSPHVLACGGTKVAVDRGKKLVETVWNEADYTFDGASGGGFSRLNPRPEWQRGPAFASYPKEGRAVPDVAGDAAGSSGIWLWVAGLNTVSFGTSAVSPFYAGVIARLTQGLGRRQFLVPLFYTEAVRRTFRDVVTGSNAKPGFGKEYRARPGWDPCTGFGTPDGEALLKALARLGDTSEHSGADGENTMAKVEIVKDDLLIASDDGKIYFVPEKDWKKAIVGAAEAEWLKEELLSRGVTLAAIPESATKGDAESAQATSQKKAGPAKKAKKKGSGKKDRKDKKDDDERSGGALIACYLVNLSGLRQSNPFEK